MSKTVVKRIFLSWPGNPFVTSCWSDVRNCGKTMSFVCREPPPTSCARCIHFCARRCGKTHILIFWMARRCSETHISILLDEPSRWIRWVGRAKLWRNANIELSELLCAVSWAFECLGTEVFNVVVTLCFSFPRQHRALYLL